MKTTIAISVLAALTACSDEGPSTPTPGEPETEETTPQEELKVAGLVLGRAPIGPDPVDMLGTMPGLCNADGWCWRQPLPQGNSLHAMWDVGDELWLVGSRRAVFHWDGEEWTAPLLPPGDADLNSVHGSAKDDVWAASSLSVYHFDGADWDATQLIPNGADNALYQVWAIAADDAWVGSEYGFSFHYDGEAWLPVQTQPNVLPLERTESFTIWGSGPDDVWFGGRAGMLHHYDGSSFERFDLGTVASIYRIWGTGASDAWLVGMDGLMFHYDGTDWQPVAHTESRLTAVDGASPTDVWFSTMGTDAEEGAVSHWDGSSWTDEVLSDSGAFYDIHVTSKYVWTFGRQGELFVNDGTHWRQILAKSDEDTASMWGADDNDVWRVGPGFLSHYDGAQWSQVDVPVFGLKAVHGRTSKDMWAVGQFGKTLHFDGETWTEVFVGEDVWLQGVWVRSDGTAYAVGDAGAVFFFDGEAWAPIIVSTTADLLAVWGGSDDDGWAVGTGGTILHFDGSDWLPYASPTAERLEAVHGSSDGEVWIVGFAGTALHKEGNAFVPVQVYEPADVADLRDVHVSNAGSAWVVGAQGNLLEWDGTAWHRRESSTGETLGAIAGPPGGSLWIAGGGGVVLERP